MFHFTGQERKFIVFLVITFCFGAGTGFYRKTRYEKHNAQWSAEHRQLQAQFFKISEENAPTENGEADTILQDQSRVGLTKAAKKRIIGKININTASIGELQSLPRIGPALAKEIVVYREREGPFQSIDDIKKVKRIGTKTFEMIKNSIAVN